MFIPQIMEAIRRGGEEAHEAALALGLLIEREKVHRPAGDDGGIRVILGDEFANRRLSDIELTTAIDELINYINTSTSPHPMAVWALTKSYDPRIVPHLISLFDRDFSDLDKVHSTYEALLGIINTGITSMYKDQSLTAIRKGAEQGHGLVKETATQYLNRLQT